MSHSIVRNSRSIPRGLARKRRTFSLISPDEEVSVLGLGENAKRPRVGLSDGNLFAPLINCDVMQCSTMQVSASSGSSSSVGDLVCSGDLSLIGDSKSFKMLGSDQSFDAGSSPATVGSMSCGAILSSGNFTNGTNPMTTGALASGAITSSGGFNNGTNAMTTGVLSSGAITSSGEFNNGTNAMTTGALSSGAITSSSGFNNGTNPMTTGVLASGAITSSGGFNNGTNPMTTGDLASGAITSSGDFKNGTNSISSAGVIVSTTTPLNEQVIVLHTLDADRCLIVSSNDRAVQPLPVLADSKWTGLTKYRGMMAYNGDYERINVYDGFADQKVAWLTDIPVVPGPSQKIIIRAGGAGQTLTDNILTIATVYDTPVFQEGSLNRSGGEILVGVTGRYLVGYTVVFSSSSSVGRRTAYMLVNHSSAGLHGIYGKANLDGTASASADLALSGSALMNLTNGDLISVYVVQTSGGNLDITASLETRFWATSV